MIDLDYIETLLVEQKQLSEAAMERGEEGVREYLANVGIDQDGVIDFATKYALANALRHMDRDRVSYAAAVGVRMFQLGVLAGRDRTQDPRGVAA